MSWAHKKRRKLKAKRDSWYILGRTKVSLTTAIKNAVEELSGEEKLKGFLAKYPVIIEFYSTASTAYVFEVIRGNKPAYLILLPSTRYLGLVESFAHELGHIYSWVELRSKGKTDDCHHFYEEIFAVEFAEKWSISTENRILTRRLIILAAHSDQEETQLFL